MTKSGRIMTVALIVILLVSIALIIGDSRSDSVQNANTPAPVVPGWNVYVNELYHYAIDYPPNWTATETTDIKNGAAFFPANSRQTEDAMSIYGVFIKEKGLPISECKTSLLEKASTMGTLIEGFDHIYSVNQIVTLNGLHGYTALYSLRDKNNMPIAEPAGPYTFFSDPLTDCSTGREGLIEIAARGNANHSVYDQMISSFRFVSQ